MVEMKRQQRKQQAAYETEAIEKRVLTRKGQRRCCCFRERSLTPSLLFPWILTILQACSLMYWVSRHLSAM